MLQKNQIRLVAGLTLALCSQLPAARDSRSQTFSVPQTWHVPAATLPAGNYSITVVDHLPDRAILKIVGSDHTTLATFIAIPNPAIQRPGKSGPVMWQSGKSGDSYLRGWLFAGDPVVMEFAYPKADAVTIARQQGSAVPAVDPASEGMKPVPNALASKDDMNVVSLWLLSTDKVGPDAENAEIKAARYQPGASAPEPKRVAAVGSRLPKTASELPLVLFVGCLAFVFAFSMRYVRRVK